MAWAHCPYTARIVQGAWLRNFSNGAGGGEAKRNAIPKGHRSSKRLNDRGPVTWQSVGLLVGTPHCDDWPGVLKGSGD